MSNVVLEGNPDGDRTEHIVFTHDEVAFRLRGEEAFQAMFGGLSPEDQADMRAKIQSVQSPNLQFNDPFLELGE